jgi:putative DNA primase/helicase
MDVSDLRAAGRLRSPADVSLLPAVPISVESEPAEPVERPTLLLRGDVEERAQTLLARLEDAHTSGYGPRLYQRGRELVRVVQTDPADRRQRPRTVIESVTPGRLRAALLEGWSLRTPTGEEGRTARYTPPPAMLGQILDRDRWTLPVLDRIIRVPGLGPDGAWLTRDGYVPDLGAWIDLGGLTVPTIPSCPTDQDVRAAVALLADDTLGDFPFVGDADRANALGLLLAPLVRHAIDGHMPLWLISAAEEGTGKGLLGDALAEIATGDPPTSTTERHGEDEWRKSVSSLLAKSPAIIRLDNLSRRVSSAALASVLTQRRWVDRLLGRNDAVLDLPNDAVWTATANNPKLSAELTRRTVMVRLESPCARPSERPRSAFRQSPLLPWVRRRRADLLRAALTMIARWVAAGRPRWAGTSMGSYESACETLGGILDACNVPGWLGNRDELRASTDDDTAMIDALVSAWLSERGTATVTAGDLYVVVDARQELADLLGPVLGDGSPRSQRTRLGKALGRWVGRIHREHRIARNDVSSREGGVALYQLVPVAP